MIYTLITNEYPYPGRIRGPSDIYKLFRDLASENIRIRYPGNMQVSFKSIIQSCLSFAPQDRPSALELHEAVRALDLTLYNDEDTQVISDKASAFFAGTV